MRKRGFTLIELLVVIAIIGILATLMLMGYRSVRQKARDTQRKTNMRSYASGAEVFFDSIQHYPSVGDCITYTAGTSTCATALVTGGGDAVFASLLASMQLVQSLGNSLPGDPTAATAKRYYSDATSNGMVCVTTAAGKLDTDTPPCTATTQQIANSGNITPAIPTTVGETVNVNTLVTGAQEGAFCQTLESPNTQMICNKTAQ